MGGLTGAVASFITTGSISLKSIAIGALSGVAFNAVGNAFVPGRLANSSHSFARSLTRASNGGKEVLSGLGRVAKAISHGAVGGVRAVLGGGKFKAGFLSGSFAQFSSQVTANIEGPGGYAASSLGGGIGVKLAGGDFSEGAITGAIGRALNDSLSHGTARKDAGSGISFGDDIGGQGFRAPDHALRNGLDEFHSYSGAPDLALENVCPEAYILGGVAVGTSARLLGAVFGPAKNWVRFGPSYSKNMGATVDMSLRWGASPVHGGKYVNQIGSPALRNANQWLRQQQIPGNGWRTADPGHLHLY